MYLEPTFESVS